VKWLAQNSGIILDYLKDELPAEGRVDPNQLAKLLRLVAGNPDGVDSEICLVHGDLNYANVICDEVDNVWFIDWTHSGYAPIEKDFAKLENDAATRRSRRILPSSRTTRSS
jgi:aminoglycoside phosphotransferase (APT) family kinase protein